MSSTASTWIALTVSLGGLSITPAARWQAPYDILVDDIYAKQNGTRVGQTIKLLNHEFHVAGIVEHGKGARLFISRTMAEELVGDPGKASIFYVKCTDPKFTDQTADAIHALLSDHTVRPIKEYMELMELEQLAVHKLLYHRDDHHSGWHRIPGDLPFHVHNDHGAHAGDRDFEGPWGFKMLTSLPSS